MFYILSYLPLKSMGCFSGRLMSTASDQKLFCHAVFFLEADLDQRSSGLMPIGYKRKEVLPGVSSEHVIPALGVLEDSEGFYLFLWAP